MATTNNTLVPCDCEPPRSSSESLPNGGWYTRAWKDGEKKAYKLAALMKPIPDDNYR